MGLRHEFLCFVTFNIILCSAQWEKYQGNLQRISQSWYPTGNWLGYNTQENQNGNSVDSRYQHYQHQKPRPVNSRTRGKNDRTSNQQSSSSGSYPTLSVGQNSAKANPQNLRSVLPQTNPAAVLTNYPSSWATRPPLIKTRHNKKRNSLKGAHPSILDIDIPTLSHQIVKSNFLRKNAFTRRKINPQGQKNEALKRKHNIRNQLKSDSKFKQHFKRRLPVPKQNAIHGSSRHKPGPGDPLHQYDPYHTTDHQWSGNIPAHVNVDGDPTKDQKLGLQVKTPSKLYNVELQRVNNNILHEDVRFLTVSVDDDGKTVFQETFKQVDLQAKAKKSHFYQDLRSGTFVSIKAHRKGEKPHSFIVVVSAAVCSNWDIGDTMTGAVCGAGNGNPSKVPDFTFGFKEEGVLFDELIVASPHSSQKRHKRSLFSRSHTVWKKEPGREGVFHFDTVKVPDIEEILKMQYNTTAHHRQKRQFSRSSEPRVPPRIEPELLLFVDFALFREFEGDSNELLEYLLHFWHAVNWKYLTIALSGSWPVIDLKIREIGVFKEPNAQPFIETSRIRRGSKLFSLYDAMDNLQKWLIRYENALPIHDIAFLQTGENACRRVRHNSESNIPFSPSIMKTLRQGIPIQLDPKEDKECVTGTAGVAYVRGACLSSPMLRGNAFNFGIGEASNSFNGVIIAAHEVGHLLGAYHDGEADASSCSSKSGYIMSYTRDDSYKFSRFSDCSIRSFQNFLRIDRAKCLLQRSSRDTLQFPTTFPGKFMSLRQQCLRFTGGPPCEEGPNQCEHLCCDDRKGEWRYTRSEPAVDGTECSSMKVCLNGQCVPLSTIGKK